MPLHSVYTCRDVTDPLPRVPAKARWQCSEWDTSEGYIINPHWRLQQTGQASRLSCDHKSDHSTAL